jgi:hypothetical protein
MTDDEVKLKIKKLFYLGERGSGNESEVAIVKATELLKKYGLSERDVKMKEYKFPRGKRTQKWMLYLYELCSNASGVIHPYNPSFDFFIGDEIGVDVAVEMFNYLKNEINRRSKEVKGRRQKNSFRIGIIISINKALERQPGWRDIKARRDKIRLEYKEIKTKNIDGPKVDGAMFDLGKSEGEKINMSRQSAGVEKKLKIGGAR